VRHPALSDAVIYNHLAGEHTVGVYPLMEAWCGGKSVKGKGPPCRLVTQSNSP
jgi:hypothetical protein